MASPGITTTHNLGPAASPPSRPHAATSRPAALHRHAQLVRSGSAWLVDLCVHRVDHGVVSVGPGPSYEELAALVGRQAEQIARLEAEVTELRRQLGQNSRNSSRPPSSDSPFVQSAPKSLRCRCGRNRVGSRGIQGRRWRWWPILMSGWTRARVVVGATRTWWTRWRRPWSGGRCSICPHYGFA
jgi:hypothetical protein